MISKKLETFSKEGGMSSQAEAQRLIGSMVSRYPNGTPFKAYAPGMAHHLRITVRRLRALIYGEARRISAEEIERLRVVASPKKLTMEDDHARRCEAIADALEAQDPDFHRAAIDLHRDMARRLRGFRDDRGMARVRQ